MPTLDDLHAAFDELGHRAPDALSAPIRPTHRHRWAAAGLAAACTAAVAVGVPVVRAHHDVPPRDPALSAAATGTGTSVPAAFAAPLPAPADGASPELFFGFRMTLGTTYAVPDVVASTYQHATVSDDSDVLGDLWLYYAGSFDPASIDNPVATTVDGRSGYFGAVDAPDGTHADNALAWEYADGAWAVVHLTAADVAARVNKGGGSAAQRRVLEAREAAQQELIRRAQEEESAIAAATAPAHVALESPVGVAASSGLHVTSMADATDGGIALADGTGLQWQLGWSLGRLAPSDKPGATTTTIDGRTWIVYQQDGSPTALGLVADGWGMTVTPGTDATLQEMEQFAATLRFAPDLLDRDSWFDAATALP